MPRKAIGSGKGNRTFVVSLEVLCGCCDFKTHSDKWILIRSFESKGNFPLSERAPLLPVCASTGAGLASKSRSIRSTLQTGFSRPFLPHAKCLISLVPAEDSNPRPSDYKSWRSVMFSMA